MVRWSIFICLLSSYDLLNYIFAYSLGSKYRTVFFEADLDEDKMALKRPEYNMVANAIAAAAFTLG